jgi:hypothetical protein
MTTSWPWDRPPFKRCNSDQPQVVDFPARCNQELGHKGDHMYMGSCYGGSFKTVWPQEGEPT